jgi:Fur family transcriptional regulator, ferric uptake regulator
MNSANPGRPAHPVGTLADLTERLRRRTRKVTGQRLAILQILHRQPRPLSIKEVFTRLGRHGCDLATVYRSMHLLEEAGMVRRFDFGDGLARFKLVAEGDSGHHHHLVCVECTAIVEIEECFPPEWEARIAQANRFKRVTHRLEFFGVCPRCQ